MLRNRTGCDLISERAADREIVAQRVMDHFQLAEQVFPWFPGLWDITELLSHKCTPLQVYQEALVMLSEGTASAGRLMRMPITSTSRAATASTPNNSASGRTMPKRASSAYLP